MNTAKRFAFWKVFWVLLGVYLVFGALGIAAASLAPLKDQPFDINDFLSWQHLSYQLINFIFILFYYYFTLNLFYRLITDKKSVTSYVRLIVIIILVLIAFYLLSFKFLTPSKKINEQLTTGLLIFSYTLSTIFYIGISLLISYLTYLTDEKKQRKVLEEQKMQLEVEKSNANFNFLKAQINPHFLHNTLNFLYAKSLPYSQELSEGILTLSDIMRYALSEGNAKDGKAPLKDEIEHVKNVIKINQLRFSNKLNVDLQVEGVINGASIIPFVLITLVENAFKHGELKTAENPIIIKIKVNDDSLWFFCSNKKKTGPKELSTGIGLVNIKKRLDLAYGNNYKFIVKEDSDFYITELSIDKL
ncbi:MAG: histidine kinase [Flavisolibacter sp.]|nr:histidine kinase [Flavisolibacter sp.]